MNRGDDFDATLEAWLRRQAPPQAPDRLLDTALQRSGAVSQRRGLLPRLGLGTRGVFVLRAAALTAVLAVAVVLGLQLTNVSPGPGLVSPSPSALGTPSQSASPSPEPTPTPTPEPSTPAGCVNPPTDITTLIEGQQTPGFNVACYGNSPLTFDANWEGGGVADCPTQPEPAWLACSSFGLRPPGDTRKVGAPFFGVAIDPALGSLPDVGTDVRVTGHFDDPRAQTCRNTNTFPDASPEPVEDTIERCTWQFVVTDIEELQQP